MSSLKEIKSRITSVDSTKKITSAMKMVASAKLRKAQKDIENFLPYERKLHYILENFLQSGTQITSDLAKERSVQRVAVVAISSNSSLCGAFNANVIRQTQKKVEHYISLYGKENVMLFPIGKKISDYAKKSGFIVEQSLDALIEKADYNRSVEFADMLIELFSSAQVDKVELVYQHFKNAASQELLSETYLPLIFEKTGQTSNQSIDYIVEPDRTTLLNDLLPKVLRLKIYSVLLDSCAAEHAARTVAMQVATENAEDLLQELTVQYNKSRQQAITNELLDIIGGLQQ